MTNPQHSGKSGYSLSSLVSRQSFLGTAALSGAVGASLWGDGVANIVSSDIPAYGAAPDKARYTLAPILELMFDHSLPFDTRLDVLGREGASAYPFWDHQSKDLSQLRRVADRYGMVCASISGTTRTWRTTGLTAKGHKQGFLEDVGSAVAAASKVGAANLVVFVGQRQENVSWREQFLQVVEGLRRAGDLAAEANVCLTLEPFNRLASPRMSVLSASEGFEIIRAVAHPFVKLDFDLYHLQLSEGNLTNNLRAGWAEGLIRYVEVGDVPGRYEPGKGEINYAHVFRVLQEIGYDGFVGLEHRAQVDVRSALSRIRVRAGLASFSRSSAEAEENISPRRKNE